MKLNLLVLLFTILGYAGKAQNIDSIFVNLYTDSLKKGTYNYINVDGLLTNGKYLPLDSTHLVFKSDKGKFDGNSLWLDPNLAADKVCITITMKKRPEVIKKLELYIKKAPEPELKTNAELLEQMKRQARKRKKS